MKKQLITYDIFNNIMDEVLGNDLISEDVTKEPDNVDLAPKDLYLDEKVQISQQMKDGTTKSFVFVIIEIWSGLNNVYTVVNENKSKTDENLWVMFYNNNCWSLKRGLRGPVNIHVKKI